MAGTFTQLGTTLTINGAITFIGNTVGLSKALNSNNAGTEHSIGAYISTSNSAAQYDNYEEIPPTNPPPTPWPISGSTLDIDENGSFAYLNLPSGSTVQSA